MANASKTITIELNHLILFAKDKQESANFLTDLFDLPAPKISGSFLQVDFSNNVSFQYAEIKGNFIPQHYAFLISEEEFDEILQRMEELQLKYWADPQKQVPNDYNTNQGGRGLYFLDPSGHGMEIITQPYPRDEF